MQNPALQENELAVWHDATGVTKIGTVPELGSIVPQRLVGSVGRVICLAVSSAIAAQHAYEQTKDKLAVIPYYR